MIRSMTGFGEAERPTAAGRLRAEVKTVNHRFFSVQLRLPVAAERYEPLIREWLRAHLPRGHVTYSLRLEAGDGGVAGAPALQLDEPRAREYVRILREMKDRLGLAGEVDIGHLAGRLGELVVNAETAMVELPVDDVRAVTEDAARAALALREIEGAKLRADLEERLQAMEASMAVVAERAPARLVAERDRLRAAIQALAADVAVDEERLAREIAFLAERWDVNEELVRLRSHIELFRQLLSSDDPEPVGKRLGFLVQEMHREINTIGSKANDATIEHRVIALKDELERLREQVENVE
ncbi:MAG: YicC family protein [Gemmatimonadetes bacterium]|nr:YicC family protein [Gemmatimonadota bacterium]